MRTLNLIYKCRLCSEQFDVQAVTMFGGYSVSDILSEHSPKSLLRLESIQSTYHQHKRGIFGLADLVAVQAPEEETK